MPLDRKTPEADLGDQVVDALHLHHDVGHAPAGGIDQFGAGLDPLDALADWAPNLFADGSPLISTVRPGMLLG